MVLPQFIDNPFTVQLSFQSLVDRYASIANDSTSLLKANAQAILKEVANHPELTEGITELSQVSKNAPLISRLVADFFPAALSRNEIKALTVPYQNLMFNLTVRLQDILQAAGPDFEINIRDFDGDQFYKFSCGIILNSYYGTKLDFNKPFFYGIPTAEGIMKYYRILYNTDFTEIFPAGKAPEISAAEIRHLLNNYDDLALWKEKFPPGSWIMKGFTIVTMIDATIQTAVSQLKDNLLSTGSDFQQTLSSVFRSIFQISDIRAGLSIYHQDTAKISDAGFGQKIESFLLPDKNEADPRQIFCDNSYGTLINQKSYFAVASVDEFLDENPGSELALRFRRQGFKSFIIAPVIKDRNLIGFIELVSPGAGEFNSVNATKLDLVMPYLVDSIDRKIREYEHHVMSVIQTNFTALHRSVYWKFEREAQNYISSQAGGLEYNIKDIRLRSVYPLYGQVDIRNSSHTRNQSVKADLTNQLNAVLPVIKALEPGGDPEAYSKQLKALTGFVKELEAGVKADTEQTIDRYLELHIHPLLKPGEKFTRPLVSRINNYFKQTDKESGKFHAGRRKYETTLSLINEKLIEILDRRQNEIQRYFPHYYERFKTDGVEHNLYIGDNISPEKQFSNLDLRRLRLWQLLVTAEMEIQQELQKSSLPYRLGVTALLLVFSVPIDVRFRMDEKHFDMDGAYNIRYEVIKKRIDKALIKGTDERITSQGKVTIVYSKTEEEKEYLVYLDLLQKMGVTGSKIEKLHVEDLQGVSGLKALRVSVVNRASVVSRYDSLYDELYDMLS
jgi:hypothetical protein